MSRKCRGSVAALAPVLCRAPASPLLRASYRLAWTILANSCLLVCVLLLLGLVYLDSACFRTLFEVSGLFCMVFIRCSLFFIIYIRFTSFCMLFM